MIELSLHVDLRSREARRLGLPKTRLDMIENETARILLLVLRRWLDGKAGG